MKIQKKGGDGPCGYPAESQLPPQGSTRAPGLSEVVPAVSEE